MPMAFGAGNTYIRSQLVDLPLVITAGVLFLEFNYVA
jgi:hypothetical protein